MLPLILASTSPRRIELMKQVGLRFETFSPNVDEKRLKGEKPEAFVKRLAVSKAHAAVAHALEKNSASLIIAADTTVVSPKRQILEKPKSRSDAARMLRSISGATHEVLTAYAVLLCQVNGPLEIHSRVVKSKVRMRKLSPKAISRYLDRGESMDKAGAYAAQGAGMALIQSLSGSFTNVVGLPMEQLLSDLETHFGIPIFIAP